MIQKRIEKRRLENSNLRKAIDIILDDGNSFLSENFKAFDISNYTYNMNVAVEELGLDEDLINQLIEDYIIQILKSKLSFYNYIDKLKHSKVNGKVLNFDDIHNLAHKNLGVARNLRIEDAQKLLSVLLKDTDLEYMQKCTKALEFSAIRLNPLCAYETLKLIKNSL